MLEEKKKLISSCSPLAEHLHFETRVVNINPSSHVERYRDSRITLKRKIVIIIDGRFIG